MKFRNYSQYSFKICIIFESSCPFYSSLPTDYQWRQMLLSNIMPILYISIGIFLLMIKISANSPIFYFNEHMKGANTTDFDELRKGLYQNVLVDLVFIRFVSKVKVTFSEFYLSLLNLIFIALFDLLIKMFIRLFPNLYDWVFF